MYQVHGAADRSLEERRLPLLVRLIVWTFRGPLFRGPLVISLYVLI